MMNEGTIFNSSFRIHRSSFLCRRLLQLARAHHGLDARQRTLLAADRLDRVHLAERELEVETKERLFNALRLRAHLLVRHVVQLVQLFASFHNSSRFARLKFQVTSSKLQGFQTWNF